MCLLDSGDIAYVAGYSYWAEMRTTLTHAVARLHQSQSVMQGRPLCSLRGVHETASFTP